MDAAENNDQDANQQPTNNGSAMAAAVLASPNINGTGPRPSAASDSGVNKRYRPAPAKTFQCRGYGDCRMVFSRSEHLARHIRKHTGERPFSCHCGKQFSRLDNLRQHAQTVHADKQEQNERMMRDLTSLHASMVAASKAGSRGRRGAKKSAQQQDADGEADDDRDADGDADMEDADASLNHAHIKTEQMPHNLSRGLGGGARPETSTGYEGMDFNANGFRGQDASFRGGSHSFRAFRESTSSSFLDSSQSFQARPGEQSFRGDFFRESSRAGHSFRGQPGDFQGQQLESFRGQQYGSFRSQSGDFRNQQSGEFRSQQESVHALSSSWNASSRPGTSSRSTTGPGFPGSGSNGFPAGSGRPATSGLPSLSSRTISSAGLPSSLSRPTTSGGLLAGDGRPPTSGGRPTAPGFFASASSGARLPALSRPSTASGALAEAIATGQLADRLAADGLRARDGELLLRGSASRPTTAGGTALPPLAAVVSAIAGQPAGSAPGSGVALPSIGAVTGTTGSLHLSGPSGHTLPPLDGPGVSASGSVSFSGSSAVALPPLVDGGDRTLPLPLPSVSRPGTGYAGSRPGTGFAGYASRPSTAPTTLYFAGQGLGVGVQPAGLGGNTSGYGAGSIGDSAGYERDDEEGGRFSALAGLDDPSPFSFHPPTDEREPLSPAGASRKRTFGSPDGPDDGAAVANQRHFANVESESRPASRRLSLMELCDNEPRPGTSGGVRPGTGLGASASRPGTSRRVSPGSVGRISPGSNGRPAVRPNTGSFGLSSLALDDYERSSISPNNESSAQRRFSSDGSFARDGRGRAINEHVYNGGEPIDVDEPSARGFSPSPFVSESRDVGVRAGAHSAAASADAERHVEASRRRFQPYARERVERAESDFGFGSSRRSAGSREQLYGVDAGRYALPSASSHSSFTGSSGERRYGGYVGDSELSSSSGPSRDDAHGQLLSWGSGRAASSASSPSRVLGRTPSSDERTTVSSPVSPYSTGAATDVRMESVSPRLSGPGASAGSSPIHGGAAGYDALRAVVSPALAAAAAARRTSSPRSPIQAGRAGVRSPPAAA
ncbi:hypothetical protein FB107DRAFT_212992 [Schizophyllum commune]